MFLVLLSNWNLFWEFLFVVDYMGIVDILEVYNIYIVLVKMYMWVMKSLG